ncbi:MAG: hypothetical protein H6799_02410 [Candidatus Nomurabacteria bacterium]|nr:MAG: hypothetical protein H6799_02410 [Candidatus Nomurabacteria bacterium]HRV75853.1 hypothetical protein [Candidatus Saccharimonadales bacterium]
MPSDQHSAPSLSFLDGIKQTPLEAEFLDECGDGEWTVNDSGLSSYFFNVHFPGLGRGPGVVTKIIGKDTSNTAMDLAGGSNGAALQDLIDIGAIGKGLLTNYEDRRCPASRYNPLVDHIAGNLVHRDTWQKIIEWASLNTNGGFDLILHRPVGGLQYLPTRFYSGAAQVIVDLLKPGGVAFLQIPYLLADVYDNPEITRIGKELSRNPKVKGVLKASSSDGYDQHALVFRSHS